MKRGKHPTNKKRKKPQRKVKRYMELREDLQIAGRIPCEPEGAIRNERVPTETQGEQPLPGLIGKAIRHGWAVPEEKKPRLVDELVEIVENPEVDTSAKVTAYNALTKGDQIQYERDHPEEAAKAKGKTEVNVEVGLNWDTVIKEMQQPVIDTVEHKVAQALSLEPAPNPTPVESNGQETTRESES